jgi:ABC-2 type transport system ATP-binding protein
VVEKVSTRVLILRRGKVVAHDSVERLRAVLSSPSLEDVFAQVAVQEDTEKLADDMIAVMRG